MIRTSSRIPAAVWADPQVRQLDVGDQWMILALATQPDLSPAGVLPLVVSRWVGLAADATVSSVQRGLVGLIAYRLIEVDEDTAEVWVRPWVGWQRQWPNPKNAAAILAAAAEVASPTIRSNIAAHLSTLGLVDRRSDQRSNGDRPTVLASAATTRIGRDGA